MTQLAESLVGDEALKPYRCVRDEIKAFVQTLPTLLATQTGALDYPPHINLEVADLNGQHCVLQRFVWGRSQ